MDNIQGPEWKAPNEYPEWKVPDEIIHAETPGSEVPIFGWTSDNGVHIRQLFSSTIGLHLIGWDTSVQCDDCGGPVTDMNITIPHGEVPVFIQALKNADIMHVKMMARTN